MKKFKRIAKIYDKHYKFLLVIPLILLALSLGYIAYFYSINKDFIKRDISLTGGMSLTIFPTEPININELKKVLEKEISDFNLREISDFRSGKQKAIVIESRIDSTDSEEYKRLKKILEDFLGYELKDENLSIEITGSTLGQSFYKQLRFALILSFIFMAIIVFIIFRTFVPSLAVVISAFADIVMTLALVDFLGIRVSSAGIIAFLMLIGYSVDTDIMLTTRLLRGVEGLNERLLGAFKTGMTMTLTSIAAILVALFITRSFSEVLEQIFTILVIGLGFDILNTWITNASLLKWYVEGREKE